MCARRWLEIKMPSEQNHKWMAHLDDSSWGRAPTPRWWDQSPIEFARRGWRETRPAGHACEPLFHFRSAWMTCCAGIVEA